MGFEGSHCAEMTYDFYYKFGQINMFIYLLQPIILPHSRSRFLASYVTILSGAPQKLFKSGRIPWLN
jgi:hypothetical protein